MISVASSFHVKLGSCSENQILGRAVLATTSANCGVKVRYPVVRKNFERN
jgi:hypothetical protein